MAVSTAAEFLAMVAKSNLLEPDQLAQIRQWADENTAELKQIGERLIQQGMLTRWQARQLAAGHPNLSMGRYRLLDKLGAGGMGTVLKAEHPTMGRVVALKVMSKALMNRPEAIARFRREVRAAAALNHPNIVAAYDADQHGNVHFLVMEYVDGHSLDEWLKQYGRLPIDWACECARQVALGLEHAHYKGMVHRDIKPRNLLVSVPTEGGPPLVKILDMGLARLDNNAQTEEITHADQVLGTPDYMSPEQAEDSRSADIRSDIFSLGCTLYKMLAGRVPFDGRTAIEKISARLKRDAPPISTLRHDVRPGLEQVVMRMLARDPVDRYQRPTELIEDLAPYTTTPQESEGGETTSSLMLCREVRQESLSQARGDSALQDFLSQLSSVPDGNTPAQSSGPTQTEPRVVHGKRERARSKAEWHKWIINGSWCSAAVLVLIAIVLALRPGPAVLTINWPEQQRVGADLRIDRRLVHLPPEGPIRFELEPGPHNLFFRRRGYQPINENVELVADQKLSYKPQFEVLLAPPPNVDLMPPTTNKLREKLLQAWVAGRKQRKTDLEKSRLERDKQLSVLGEAAEAIGGKPQASAAEIAQIRSQIDEFRTRWPSTPAAATAAGLLVRLKSPEDALQRANIPPHELKQAGGGDATRAPSELVAVLGDSRLRSNLAIECIDYSHDGKLIAAGGADKTIHIWSTQTGLLMRELKGHTNVVTAVAFSPDDATLASASVDGTVRTWNVATGQAGRTLTEHTGPVQCLAFGSDGDTLVTGGDDKSVKVWNLSTGLATATLTGHTAAVQAVDIDASGQRVASGSADMTVRIWDAKASSTRHTLSRHSGGVHSVRFSPDGSRLASGDSAGVTWLWDSSTGSDLFPLKWDQGAVRSLAFSADGKSLVTSGTQSWFWDVARGQAKNKLDVPATAAAISADMKTLAVAAGRVASLWDVDSHSQRLPLPAHEDTVTAVAFSPDGGSLASVATDGTLVSWNLETAAVRFRHKNNWQFNSLAYSPDGKSLGVTGLNIKYAALRDSFTGHERRIFASHATGLYEVAFSPDGKWLATGSADRFIKLFQLSDCSELATLAGHTSNVHCVAFSDDARLLASGGNEATIRFWDVAGRQVLLILEGHASAVNAIALSPDGQRLASASSDKTIKIWNLETGTVQATLARHTAAVLGVAFSPDGQTLASSASDGVRLWDVATGRDKQTLSLGSGTIYSVQFSPDGRYLAAGTQLGTVHVLRIGE